MNNFVIKGKLSQLMGEVTKTVCQLTDSNTMLGNGVPWFAVWLINR